MVKNSSANAGDARNVGSISGLGGSPGAGNGNPLQYFCLESPMILVGYSLWGCKELTMTEQLNTHITYVLLYRYRNVSLVIFIDHIN